MLPMTCTYDDAIQLILRSSAPFQRRGLDRMHLLSYFAEAEHGNAGKALDALVVAGIVGFDGRVYYLNPSERRKSC